MGGFLGQLARVGVKAATGALAGDAERQQRLREEQRQVTQDAILAHARQLAETQAADEQSRQRALDALGGVMTGTAPVVQAPKMLASPLGPIADRLPTENNDPTRYQQVDSTRYIDRTATPEARAQRTFERQQKAAADAEARKERVQLFLAQQKEAADAARAAAANATTLQAAGIRANAPRQSQLTLGPDGQVIDLRQKKAEADLAKQYGREVPIQTASKYAINAANTLHAIDAARAGDRSAHFGVLYGYLQQAHPGIAVKRSDKGLLLDTQGLPADIQMKVARWTGNGGLLTPQALNEIEAETHAMAGTQHAITAPVMAQYGRMARDRGGDSTNVARDPLQGLAGAAAGLSAEDRAHAARDPGFAAWLKAQGVHP